MSDADFPPFACVTIIGVGLMGGSLGMALKARGLARRVVGVDKSGEILTRAQERGAIDAGTTDLAEGVREADGVVAAAPVGVIPALLEKTAACARLDALITDLGSTKGRIVAAGSRLFGPRFVGGHPMAGGVESGVEAARPDLFQGAAWLIVRQHPFTLAQDPFASRLAALVSALGARPIPMEAACHDRLAALVSHLPHALSFAFARTVAASEEAAQAREMAGGSYRDLMRVAAADPSLWQGIFRDNREALLAALTTFETHLRDLKRSIERD
ncbi:MAG TPA: prephenate dehydrogenase [Chthonomonadaceae bacterium]|nr:prephenate dehydrogenase [Chthonomonadaceae bacterium]